MEVKYHLWCCCTDMFGFYEGHEETLFENKDDSIKYGIEFIKKNDKTIRDIEPEPDGWFHIRELVDIEQKEKPDGTVEIYYLVKECSSFKQLKYRDFCETVNPDEVFANIDKPESNLRVIIKQKEVY